jgi:hypothetical protein
LLPALHLVIWLERCRSRDRAEPKLFAMQTIECGFCKDIVRNVAYPLPGSAMP